MIKVYHRKELYTPSKVEATITDVLIDLGDFELVAEVETDNLEKAFELTNTTEVSWPEKQGCKNLTGRASIDVRSTSVGDVIVDAEGKAHMVDWIGMKQCELKTEV
ncbi:MAG: hypothetical protein AAF391_13760 [Bacteroidota bacterium]